ncbi:hypothetical protein [Aquabacter cavernae]|uniref:hypothetical protein n=1 Tax=Aquabacter cavernae TaxID=2496029 RepID=UPI000F8E9244|nr:hypothetical protein [Aquabacter cavernae]
MVRGLAQILRAFAHLPLRRMLALCLAVCLALSPLTNAFALHHVDDGDVASLSAGTGDTAPKQTSDHATLPAADHDCHSCSVAVPNAPSTVAVMRIHVTIDIAAANLVDGRDPGAELRPPRA